MLQAAVATSLLALALSAVPFAGADHPDCTHLTDPNLDVIVCVNPDTLPEGECRYVLAETDVGGAGVFLCEYQNQAGSDCVGIFVEDPFGATTKAYENCVIPGGGGACGQALGLVGYCATGLGAMQPCARLDSASGDLMVCLVEGSNNHGDPCRILLVTDDGTLMLGTHRATVCLV